MVSVVNENLFIICNVDSSFRYEHYLRDREAVQTIPCLSFQRHPSRPLSRPVQVKKPAHIRLFLCVFLCFPPGINLSRF